MNRQEEDKPARPAFDPRRLRNALGQFATGVTVVSYEHGEERRGATVNSFTSVSMDPPLVLVSIGRNARAAEGLLNRPFAINVLASNQADVALHFAGKPRPGATLPWAISTRVPRLRGVVAWFECEPWQAVDAGDHILFLGRVVAYEHQPAAPLVFHEGQFRLIGSEISESPRLALVDSSELVRWLEGRASAMRLAEDGSRHSNT